MYRTFILLLFLMIALPLQAELATVTITLDDDSEVDIRKFPAEGDFLLLGFPCDQGTGLNEASASEAMAAAGIEVWMADLLTAHFLSRTPESIRSLDGTNVEQLIALVARETDKTIILASSGYGSVPVLRGARLWRKKHQDQGRDPLHGAILFYPHLNAGKPQPGKPVEYLPVVHDTRLNITIFQPERSPNRFTLKRLVATLEKGGSRVESIILPGVRNNFYRLKDPTPEERVMTHKIPRLVIDSIKSMEHNLDKQP
jgi:hypothetical protein